MAEKVSHPFNLGYALNVATRPYHYRRESQAVREQAEALLTLSTEQGFAQWLVVGNAVPAGHWPSRDREQKGFSRYSRAWLGIKPWGQSCTCHYLALLAEAFGQVGHSQEGLRTLREALDVVERTEERWYEAELYRLMGELLLNDECKTMNAERGTQHEGVRSPEAEVEACFQRAIQIAQKQHAKSWELRAATSLARLWQRHGKRAEARELLTPVYKLVHRRF